MKILITILAITGMFFITAPIFILAIQNDYQSSYCKHYSIQSNRNACKDGIKGVTCSDYSVIFDKTTEDICYAAQRM